MDRLLNNWFRGLGFGIISEMWGSDVRDEKDMDEAFKDWDRLGWRAKEAHYYSVIVKHPNMRDFWIENFDEYMDVYAS